jgi:glycosyltransferase involved in cell wall biosynthesis
MTYPLVSVIISVKNGERYLRSAIESVLAQEYAPFEILVVDGHSTDQTEAIAGSYSQVRHLRQADKGIAAAYNQGIAAAKGDLVAFLSHDDSWTPDKLRLQVEHMLAIPQLRYTVARVKFFLSQGMAPPAGFRVNLLVGDHVAYIMETLVARKPVFNEVGTFNTQLTTGEDVDWFSRAKDAAVAHDVIPKVLLHKRVHNANSSLNDSATNDIMLDVLRRSIERKRMRAGTS